MKPIRICLCAISCLFSTCSFAQSPLPAAPPPQQGTATYVTLFTDASGVQWRQTQTNTWTLSYIQVSGTVPVAIPLPVPPSPPPNIPPSAAPLIGELRDAARNQLLATTPIAAGSAFFIDGSGFGGQAGVVTVGAAPALVTKWSDIEIALTVPAPAGTTGTTGTTVAGVPLSVSVIRTDGATVSTTLLLATAAVVAVP